MKLKMMILLKDNSIIQKTIKNPDDYIKVTYEISDNMDEFIYRFRKDKIFVLNAFFKKKFIFYKHGETEPLDIGFRNNSSDMKEITHILRSNLFDQLISSTKPNLLANSPMMWITLAGIGALVLIIFMSKVLG